MNPIAANILRVSAASTTSDIELTPVEPDPLLSVLVQGSPHPVYRGVDPAGNRLLCGHCLTSVLAERVGEGEMYDLAFRCHACGGLSMGPRLPAGRPLPWQKTVLLPPGNYMIKGTIDGKGEAVLAGQDAVSRAQKEIGMSVGIELGKNAELDADFLDALVERTKTLLGAKYDELAGRHQRGLRSPTPAKFPHRLMELTSAAELAAASFRAGRPAVDPVATAELHGMVEQLERWKNHPSWPGFVAALKSPQDFPHVLITLAAASFLTDAGNGVELVVAPGKSRSPDLRLHLGARNAVSTEVKVPRLLHRPPVALDERQANEIVRDAFGKAGSGATGQLAPGADGLLVVGGFSLRSADLNALEAAARRLFTHYLEERKHVMGIAFVSLVALVESRPSGIGQTLPTLSGALDARIVKNENYAGPNRISEEQRPALRPIGGSSTSEARPRTDRDSLRPPRAERRAAERAARRTQRP